MTTITIDLPDHHAATLELKAAKQGVTMASFARHVLERALADQEGPDAPDDSQQRAKVAAARIREIRTRPSLIPRAGPSRITSTTVAAKWLIW